MTSEVYDALKLQVMRHEGKRLTAYADSVGVLTIGYGRNLEDQGISDDEAMFLLENDLDAAVSECETAFPWFASLDGVRQRVIADMCFNLGLPKLRLFKATLRAVSEGRYEDAAKGMLASLWARQTHTRALRLAEMMRTGHEAA